MWVWIREPLGNGFSKIHSSLDAFVAGSLICQFILLMAPVRKRSRFAWPYVSFAQLLQLWLALYVMASFPRYHDSGGWTGDLRVFWVPFIISHLGGPNTLTSLTLSDNELWLRFASELCSPFYAVGLALCRRLVFLEKDLWWPTALMFLVGAFSFIEKVICQFLARLTKFRESTLPKPDAGVNYAELMEMYSSFEGLGIRAEPVEISSTGVGDSADGSDDKLSQVSVVKQAYRFFHEFQGLFVNSVFTYNQRDRIRRHFLGIRNAEDAFSICEVELNFAYDVFYTKAILTHKLQYYPLFNVLSLLLQLVSLVLWIRIDKHKFYKQSVHVTNFLVGGSVAHTLLSLLMFSTSDWFIPQVIKHKEILGAKSKLFSFYKFFLTARARIGPLMGNRWSRSISQLNLLNRIVAPAPWIRRATIVDSPDELSDFIFGELVIRSHYAEHPTHVEELCSARGMWVLRQLSREHTGLEINTFEHWISDVEYEESLILWHLATTLCYYTSEEEGNGQMPPDLRKLSKIISDYMLFLLIRKQSMMPPSVGIFACMIYRDTIAEGRRFCNRLGVSSVRHPRLEKRLREACGKILEVDTDVISPRRIMGNESKAVLFEACALAKELGKLSNRWEVISKVLAEMLFYCAAHFSPSAHMRNLKEGGELLTLVWLLMSNLGLGKQFRHKKHRDRPVEIFMD